jgi:hypothetical protein
MDFGILLTYLSTNFPVVGEILIYLGVLVITGQTVVAVTPSKSDDEWMKKLEEKKILGPLVKALGAFAPIQKK